MENNIEYREKIKCRIQSSILKFREKSLSYNELISIINGNISALDGLDKELEKAKYRVCGKLEIIHHTVDTDKEFNEMLKEIDKFEPYLDKI